MTKTNEVFDQEKFDLLKRKLGFAHEKWDNMDDIERCTEPPSIDDHKSSLTQETITKEQHENIKKVWKVFKIENALQFGNYYCHLDVILLVDILFKFRDWIYEWSRLDCIRYISMPGLRLVMCLKYVAFHEVKNQGGLRSGGPRSWGRRSEGPRSGGPRSGGPRSRSPRSGGPRFEGPRFRVPRSGGPRSEDPDP